MRLGPSIAQRIPTLRSGYVVLDFLVRMSP